MKIIKHGVISKSFDGRGAYWGTVARLPDGKIGAVWSGGRMGHVCPFGRIEMATSVDGDKFTLPSIIFDSLLDDRDAGLTAWGNKTVLTTFTLSVDYMHYVIDHPGSSLWMDAPKVDAIANLKAIAKLHLNRITPEYQDKHIGSLLFISEDGENFDEFTQLPISAPHGPIVLKNGKLFYAGRTLGKIILKGTENEDKYITWNNATLQQEIYVMQTADGKTWDDPVLIEKGESCKDFDLHEPHAVECDNGDILVVSRAHTDTVVGKLTLVISRSTDGGKTFTPFETTGFLGAPPHLLKLKNGDLLLSYSRRTAPLSIRARISKDNGYTWSEELILCDIKEQDFGYPSSVELDDGKILTAYYASNHFTPGENIDNDGKFAYVTWEL